MDNVAKKRNTRETSSLDCIGNGDPMHDVCIPHSIPRVYGNSKGEGRGRNRHKNNS